MRNFSVGVGFFDSGIGGLTVLDACKRVVTNTPFYYFGDNERAPYGNLPTNLIRAYACEAMDLFSRIGVKVVVLACNTVTAVCADELRLRYPFSIIGVEPAVMPAAKQGGRIGILTTCATAQSVRFQTLIKKAESAYPNAELLPLPCDGLAQAIESGLQNGRVDYEKWLPPANLDGVVLGCTHYVFIRKQIEKFYHCPSFDGNVGVANHLRVCMEKVGLEGEKAKFKKENNAFMQASSTDNHDSIFFLGARSTLNEHIYEQMFAKINGEVVKNPKKN